MWWNFVGRSHEEIAAAREDWMAGRRFGAVADDPAPPLPAPGAAHHPAQGPRPHATATATELDATTAGLRVGA